MCVREVDVQCVLQFTFIFAAGCALRRRASRVIHRRELFNLSFTRFHSKITKKERKQMTATAKGGRRPSASLHPSLKPTIVKGYPPLNRPSHRRARGDNSVSYNPAQASKTTNRIVCTYLAFDNDPSAGSPTETLLRLLLPLDSQV